MIIHQMLGEFREVSTTTNGLSGIIWWYLNFSFGLRTLIFKGREGRAALANFNLTTSRLKLQQSITTFV